LLMRIRARALCQNNKRNAPTQALTRACQVSLHLRYFGADANENYVCESRAFRDAADGHWHALEQLESTLGLGQVKRAARAWKRSAPSCSFELASAYLGARHSRTHTRPVQ
jgi:hypothetical protein